MIEDVKKPRRNPLLKARKVRKERVIVDINFILGNIIHNLLVCGTAVALMFMVTESLS